MVDRLVVSSIRLAFKVATPEKITVVVLFKAIVNTVGGLLASRRVFSWLPLGFFCSYSTDSD